MEFNDHTEYAADLQKLEDGFHEWSSLAPAERVRCIRKLRRIISKHSDDLARALSNECHRPLTESLAQEILPVLEMARYCEKKFPRWLRTRRFRYMRPGFMIKQNHLIRQPLGVMLVITPANFPFTLGMMSMIYMLLAGNTVVIKPAENSTEVGPLIEKMLLESGLAPRFAQVVPGGPATGEWLVERQEIRKVSVAKCRKLTALEVDRIFDGISGAALLKPLIEKARNKMASRDLAFRDALHDQLKDYVTPVERADFERFLGEKSKELSERLEEAKDVMRRLKERE